MELREIILREREKSRNAARFFLRDFAQQLGGRCINRGSSINLQIARSDIRSGKLWWRNEVLPERGRDNKNKSTSRLKRLATFHDFRDEPLRRAEFPSVVIFKKRAGEISCIAELVLAKEKRREGKRQREIILLHALEWDPLREQEKNETKKNREYKKKNVHACAYVWEREKWREWEIEKMSVREEKWNDEKRKYRPIIYMYSEFQF